MGRDDLVGQQIVRNELNADGALKGYSTEAKGVNLDGTSFDYASLASGLKTSFGGVKSLNFTKVKEDFKFISKNFLLICWYAHGYYFLLKSLTCV